jgi:hypothetical protein
MPLAEAHVAILKNAQHVGQLSVIECAESTVVLLRNDLVARNVRQESPVIAIALVHDLLDLLIKPTQCKHAGILHAHIELAAHFVLNWLRELPRLTQISPKLLSLRQRYHLKQLLRL